MPPKAIHSTYLDEQADGSQGVRGQITEAEFFHERRSICVETPLRPVQCTGSVAILMQYMGAIHTHYCRA
jgi:hypothetical protein